MLLSVAGLALGLAAAELVLQVAGVEVRAGRLTRDAVLGWRNRPGWKGPVFSINSHGCLGPEFPLEKPAGTVRILCLGDSCTAGDFLPSFDDTYPRQLDRGLREKLPRKRFEVINAGVGGYSSFQGRVWLERDLLRGQPDLGILYFGWNDHWPARLGGPDKAVSDSWGERLRASLAWCKLLQLAIRAYHEVRGRELLPSDEAGAPAVHTAGRPPRVSQEDYADNLRAMIRAVRERGGETILVTAPDYLEVAEKDELPIPGGLAGGAAGVEALVRLHAGYNAIARRVAREEGAGLVDLAAQFAGAPNPAKLFWKPPNDFIHLSREGYARLARALVETMTNGE